MRLQLRREYKLVTRYFVINESCLNPQKKRKKFSPSFFLTDDILPPDLPGVRTGLLVQLCGLIVNKKQLDGGSVGFLDLLPHGELVRAVASAGWRLSWTDLELEVPS
jgi:hypothetical protein